MAKSLGGIVQWYGGKGLLAGRILKLLPNTKIYVEPYGGAAAVLFAKEASPIEVYNDLDGNLVTLFRTMQNEKRFRKLKTRLESTLMSLDEFRLALETLNDDSANDDDRAWAFFVAQNQGFGGVAGTEGRWTRRFSSQTAMAASVAKWLSRLRRLASWHDRIRCTQIDARDALEVIAYWDKPETTFYCDPPYVLKTRKKGNLNVYTVEQPELHHRRLVSLLLQVRGAVLLSGYESEVYERLGQAGWDITRWDWVCYAATTARGSSLKGTGVYFG